ncbi:hypothetical protein [Streptomyces mirabilis]|uniref:hypothetical protein n=1 Tax=Streptomyces mirabilis TaxID=68239 RepID=UPI0036C2B984
MRSSTRTFLASVLGAPALGGVLLVGGTGAVEMPSVRAVEAPSVVVIADTPAVVDENNPWS